MNVTKEEFLREIAKRRKEKEMLKNDAVYGYFQMRYWKRLQRKKRA